MAVQTLPKKTVTSRRWAILPQGTLARREAKWFWFFISPWLFGYLAFTLGPLVTSIYLSLTRYNLKDAPVFVGFNNYVTLYNDPIFWKSLQVTGYYTLLAVPAGIIGGLLIAVLLNQKIPFMGTFRTIYYVPSLIGGSISVILLFQWILNPQVGILNYIISSLVGPRGAIPLGIIGPRWLQDPKWVVPALVLLSLFSVGSSMLIYLSALQGVPTHLYEAATLDGANRIQQFFNVTLPMISPVLLFTFITGVVGTSQIFSAAYIISAGSGGPAYASMFYNLYLFLNAFRRQRMGLAAAMACILFVVFLIITYLFLVATKRFVYYEADEEGGL